MTEKRFEVDSKAYSERDIRFFLKDNDNELVDGYGDKIYWGGDSTNGLKQIVNKLNELHEENKELKEQLKDCTEKAKEEIRKQAENEAIRWANIGR